MSGRGRGWYYKQKYGGGGGGRGGGRSGRGFGDGGRQEDFQQEDSGYAADQGGGRAGFSGGEHGSRGSHLDLIATLKQIDNKGYKAYNDIKGRWSMQQNSFTLCIHHVQSDPFASPSRVSVEVPSHVAQFPSSLWETKTRKTALCDFLARSLAAAVQSAGADIRTESGGWGGEKGGEMNVDNGGQHVLERTAVLINAQGDVEARFTVALPARGRTVLGGWAIDILVKNLPKYVERGLHYKKQNIGQLQAHVQAVEDSQALRDSLPGLGLVAFVGNGSILPRASGASDKPYPKGQAVPFQSPPSLEVEVRLPNCGAVKGMGIGPGVSLIVGGGFHGKSTLLKALEAGVTDKIPGDGRELVVVHPSACKIRAEDGRRVEAVNISPFISNLPYDRDTSSFRSDDASGSTSQAANIMEALEVGCSLMLVDEDTTATNFMIRDARMQALISPDKEPITPLVAKIQALSAQGVSCILVIGGSGDYFEVAQRVIAMDSFVARDVTSSAHAVAQQFGLTYSTSSPTPFGSVSPRTPVSVHPGNAGGGREGVKVKTRQTDTIQFGDEELDLSAVEQLFDKSQTRAIGDALQLIRGWITLPQWRGKPLSALLEAVDAEIDEKGLDALSSWTCAGNLARPRKFEIAAAINRLRSVKMEQV